jgi:hypothetical protein
VKHEAAPEEKEGQAEEAPGGDHLASARTAATEEEEEVRHAYYILAGNSA